MIIAHLIYDKRSLYACSLTCLSWYIAAVPHLHHTLITSTEHQEYRTSRWPNPIWYMDSLGLLPLVRKFHILTYDLEGKNTPKTFQYFTL